MPLPKSIRSKDLVGKTVVSSRNLNTDYDAASVRVHIPKGARLHVASTGRGMNVETDPCPCCGMRVYATDVVRASVDPDDGRDGPAPTAFWTSQEEKGDHLWTHCSACGFAVENYKAVEQGTSSDDYIRPKYRFCPSCGHRMGVMGMYQKRCGTRPNNGKEDEPDARQAEAPDRQ